MDDFSMNGFSRTQFCGPLGPASPMDTSYKLDEGYSEETRSHDEADFSSGIDVKAEDTPEMAMPTLAGLPNWVLTLSEGDRSEFAYNVLRSLRTSSVAAIVERLRPLLHIDPITVLPPEIMSEIYSYLNPLELLDASRVSQAWREKTLDSQLWKRKFISEGWSIDKDEVRRFESSLRNSSSMKPQKTRSRRAGTSGDGRSDHRQRKRVRGILGVSRADAIGNDEDMQDADSTTAVASLHNMGDPMVLGDPQSPLQYVDKEEDETNMLGRTPLVLEPQFLLQSPDWPRLNFHNLYKQKRRLEDNWAACRYKPFQLPHRDHPEEAHIECVYTIQYLGKHLVSGSRDRTLRIWDLDTQRLVRKPLLGHSGSVLCLQFDSSTKEDIIISGSSDTDVIIWRFSTGKQIKRIPRAHRESVLNLKFDERFLITCSKDKTIRIWSRTELRPGDKDYPIKGVDKGGHCPAYIVDLSSIPVPRNLERSLTPDQRKPIEPYTLLMTLDTHGAAVNAVQIYNDQIVSASGDRTLRVWDPHTGVQTALCTGHTKGIACVQYDGKRLVSGSSDDTIRIYDPITQAEVGCLAGHTKLVRTIQASFGDYPGTRETLDVEAANIDRQYFEAKRSGALPMISSRTFRDYARNAGSRRPQDIMAYGAKLPPGGGGSRWGRIVSGSYDETVIIWKKAPDGRWVVGHRLRQGQALRAAGGPLLAYSEVEHYNRVQALQVQQENLRLQQQANFAASGWRQQPTDTASSQSVESSQVQSAPIGQIQSQPASYTPQQLDGQSGATVIPDHMPQRTTARMSQIAVSGPQTAQPTMEAGAPAYHSKVSQNATSNDLIPNHSPSTSSNAFPNVTYQNCYQQIANANTNAIANAAFNSIPPTQPQQQQQQQQQPNEQPQQHPLQPPQTQQPPQQQQPPPQQPQSASQAAGIFTQPNARVFKLQFDARRIICCSQDPKIVGWDFANGDEKIIECSRFFSPPV